MDASPAGQDGKKRRHRARHGKAKPEDDEPVQEEEVAVVEKVVPAKQVAKKEAKNNNKGKGKDQQSSPQAPTTAIPSKRSKRSRDDEPVEEHVEEEQVEEEEGDHGDQQAEEEENAATEEDAAVAKAKQQELVSKMRIIRKAPEDRSYTKFGLNQHIVTALEHEFKFQSLTEIQALTIPEALTGRDLLAEAKTGAGKTLSFLIPVVEIITRAKFKPENGTASIIIGPTRELCQQIEGVLLRLLKAFHGSITFLCCIGGINRKSEGFKLASGQQVVVSTPGRLLDHLTFTTDWHTKNLLTLVVDEADRVLDNGFEEDMRQIVQKLPANRQTFLFSATQTTKVEQLARVSFHRPPTFASVKKKEDEATVSTLEQGYVICPSEQRFLLLYHFIKRNVNKKVIVFFSSRNSVSYHAELLNYIDVPCVAFHGRQKQHQRSATYMQFCNAASGVLLTTDVAARGLDIPKVDWIIQFDPPDEPTKYIHRVGRTARAGLCGNALMFLLPSEKLFLKYLFQDANLAVNEFEFDSAKLNLEIQTQLEKLVNGNYYLKQSARQAYEGYLLSYSSCQLKNVFNVQQLDLASVARGFGLDEPPPLKIDLSQSAAHLNKKARNEYKANAQSRDPKRARQATQERRQGGGNTQYTR